jgi:hypothetical protein
MLAIEIVDARRDLARAPLPDSLLQELLFFAEVEINHFG